jgi:hypothetical protein
MGWQELRDGADGARFAELFRMRIVKCSSAIELQS